MAHGYVGPHMSRPRNTILPAALLATVLVPGVAATAAGAPDHPRARAAADGCATHPSDPSVVCTRNGGTVVDVCDRQVDGHRTYARVQTTATYPNFASPFYDDNGGRGGCANVPFNPRVIAVAACVQAEGCGAFRAINPPPAAPGTPPPPKPPTPSPPAGNGLNGTGASRLAELSLRYTSTPRRTRRMRFTTTPTVVGQLVDEQGTPITAAKLNVLVRPRQSGARFFDVTTVTTGADGAFRYQFGPGASRTLRVAYTAVAGDAKPATQSDLRTLVRASLTAHAPRSARVGRRIRVTGRLLRLARGGVPVSIQARDGRVWRTIGQTRTHGRAGRYSWPYRFKGTAAGRSFRLRARVSAPNYPFAAGTSRSVRVRVR